MTVFNFNTFLTQFLIHNTDLKCYCIWYWNGSVYNVFLYIPPLKSRVLEREEVGHNYSHHFPVTQASRKRSLRDPWGHLWYQHTQYMGKIRSPRKNPILVKRLIWGDTCTGKIWDGTIPIRPSLLLKTGTYLSLISCGWETWEKAACYHDLNIVCMSVCLHGRVSILIHHFRLLILHIPAHIPPLPVICLS